MNEPRFPVGGTGPRALVGRASQLTDLRESLLKKTPDHLSIVGPRFVGKTVFLKNIAQALGPTPPFQQVIYWDLGLHTPHNDEEFLNQLAQFLNERFPGYLDFSSGTSVHFSDLKEMVECLASEGTRILWLWDSFDVALKVSGQFTRNLWDNLRDLAQSPAFRLVVASRRRLHEALRDEASVTSEFWGIFRQTPIFLGPYEHVDVESIFALAHDLKLEKGVQTELLHWTGFFPPLFLAVLNNLKAGNATSQDVCNAAGRAREGLKAYLDSLWKDLNQNEQDYFQRTLETKGMEAGDVPNPVRESLECRGMIALEKGRLHSSCRYLEQEMDQNAKPSNLKHLFSDKTDFQKNMVKVLELRFASATIRHERSRRILARILEDLSDSPQYAMRNLRDLVMCCFDQVWEMELGPNPVLPAEWLDAEIQVQQIPEKRPEQLRWIRRLAGIGPDRNCPRRFQRVGAQECALLDSLYTLQNFGQHQESGKASFGTAISAIFSAIELLERLQ
ncbi:MAG TPA: hypothetical protein VLM37_05135 [Fibrobacteraceae bacterium]|nr:hypothetical protein [Fibrobacteraceae bacterium]